MTAHHPSPTVTKPGVGLAVVALIACVAQFMVVLDASIVNVALPAMKLGLGLSTTGQQWVVNGYLITFGGLLLLASRASDLFGRRHVFQLGVLVFTAASLLGGLATDGATLLAARFAQGVGAAALGPASLSLIMASHHDPRERTKAMTWWGVAAASAGAVGMVLGGVLTASLGWRWVMLVNVPVGVALLVATFAFLQRPEATDGRARIDVPGAVMITGAVAAVVYGISAAPQHGWGSAQVLTALGAGLVLLAASVLVERRAAQPLVPFELFAERNLAIGNLLAGCLGVVITAPLFFLSLYLQQVLGQSALRAGLSLLPMAAAMGLGVLVSPQLMRHVGTRTLVVTGGVAAAAGLLWLSRLPDHADYAVHVLVPTIAVAGGTSLMVMPGIVAATSGVHQRNAGIASGLINMSRQVGAALGLAALVTVAATATRHAHGATGETTVHGYRVALLVVAAVSLAAAAVSLLLRVPRASAAAAEPADDAPLRVAVADRP